MVDRGLRGGMCQASSKEANLEVDLEYAKEVHNKHSDYPLVPENMNMLEQYLSDQRELFIYYYNGKEPKDEKTPNFFLHLMEKER